MISQDTFNKIMTTILLLYCMIMYALSWYTGRVLDLQGFLILLAPILTHMGHLLTGSRKDIAVINQERISNGLPTSNGSPHA